jgi:hypothetical protein
MIRQDEPGGSSFFVVEMDRPLPVVKITIKDKVPYVRLLPQA